MSGTVNDQTILKLISQKKLTVALHGEGGKQVTHRIPLTGVRVAGKYLVAHNVYFDGVPAPVDACAIYFENDVLVMMEDIFNGASMPRGSDVTVPLGMGFMGG